MMTEAERKEYEELSKQYQRLVNVYGRGRVVVPGRLERLQQKAGRA